MSFDLPTHLAPLFAQAIEAVNALTETSPFQAHDAAHALLDNAMFAAGFPVHDARTPEDHPTPGHLILWSERTVFTAASLTETQRAVLAEGITKVRA